MGVPEEGGGPPRQPSDAGTMDPDELRMLVDGVDECALFLLDASGRILVWGRGATLLNGYPAAEIVGSHLARLYPPGTPRERVDQHLAHAERYGRHAEEGWRARRDGSLYWSESTLTVVRTGEGRRRGFAAVARDRTETLRTLQRLRRLVSLLSESQRRTGIGSWEWDTVTDEILWSDEMYRIHGLQPAPIPGTGLGGFLELVHPADRERVAAEVRLALAERRSFAFEHRILRPDGEQRVLRAEGRTVLDEGGKALRMLGTAEDVTDAPSH